MKALQHLAPGLAVLAVALEFGQGLVQQLLFLGRRATPLQEVALLKLTEPLEHLRSLVGFELRQFGQDLGFAHGANLPPVHCRGKRADTRFAPRSQCSTPCFPTAGIISRVTHAFSAAAITDLLFDPVKRV